MMKRFGFIFLIAFVFLIQSEEALSAPRCESLFLHSSSEKSSPIANNQPAGDAETWEQLYKKSDLRPRPALWLRIRQSLEKNVTAYQNPLETVGTDADRIGRVNNSMTAELPILRTLIEVEQQPYISHADFIKLKRVVANQIIAVSHKPTSHLQVFAALEALKYISKIESRVEFPRTKEDIEKEKKEEAEKKKEEEKKKKEQEEDKDDEQEEDPPEWNKTEDKYKPENKDLSEKGKKQKTVEIAFTDAEVPKKVLRQKIYDLFDFNDWTTNPVQRNQIVAENKFTKKLIIDPLGGPEVDLPIPYGYTLIPGQYKDYQIKEVGPGEFKLLTHSKEKVVLGLSRILSEPLTTSLSSANKNINHQELMKKHAAWPKHLLTFTESLRGLSAVEAAARLEKYISLDGGFLYYSKGDKISKDDLSKIDQKVNLLLSQMPKPIAFANAGAFNCDGAAWIGALLMRDILGHEVRIAGGRTSAGKTKLENVDYHVVRSSDPAHAWIEVYDGKHWLPFDMTPKINTPEMDSSPSDLKQERDQDQKPEQKQGKQKDKQDKKDKQQDKKNDDQEEVNKKEKTDESSSEEEMKRNETKAQEDTETKNIEDLIQSKSTQRLKDESQLQLIDKILKRNELVFLEQLIHEGIQTKVIDDTATLIEGLKNHPVWKNLAQRSDQKLSSYMNEARLVKFPGLSQLVNEMKVDFSLNQAREAKHKLVFIEKILLQLSDYRNLTKPEIESLAAIQKISARLNAIKHKNSGEFELVDQLLKELPGTVSKEWIQKTYGADYAQLGSSANINLANDLVSGKLQSLLKMAAVREFVDMTLSSTQEPNWMEEPTLNRSIVPKPRQDLIVTRNPLDFAKMLWTLRPGEHMFAPTIQGRQFAIGSLETRRVPNPKNPTEKKISVVYYDISGSMGGAKIQTQDAILLAFVDKALSETDAIGRSTHEIYLIPFGDKRHEGVHISSREDALSFISRRMSYTSPTPEGNAYTKFIEEFYALVASSYAKKSLQGREKLFQKANMVLLTDGCYSVDPESIAEARKKLPAGVDINLNFVSIGDSPNAELIAAAESGKTAGKKPPVRHLDTSMTNAVASLSVELDPDAFATQEKVSGQLLAELNSLLQKISIDPRSAVSSEKINSDISQIQITKKDVSKLSGLREILNLQKLDSILSQLELTQKTRQKILLSILESYQPLTGRTWKDMTPQELEAFENLQKWAR